MLFGHQTTDTNGQVPSNIVNDNVVSPNPLATDPATGVSLPTTPADNTVPAYLETPQPASSPLPDASLSDETAQPLPSEVAAGEPVDQELLSLKQQALSELTPLVDHLEQTPEEKFRTTMMMIQSTDNQALIKEAYAAAQAIPDEKARAQALLDVINEINYFTQQKG